MNKRGSMLLPEETLKIIIAIIGVSLLIVLMYSLYSAVSKSHKLTQARASIEILYSNIQLIENQEKTQTDFILESPNNWWITAWPYKDFNINGKTKPSSCKGEYCICLCPINFKSLEKSIKECEEKGICKDVSKKITTIHQGDSDNLLANLRKSKDNNLLFRKEDRENLPLDIKGITQLRVVDLNISMKLVKRPNEKK